MSAVTAAAAAAGAFGATAASAAPAKPAGGHCSPSVSSQFFGQTVEPYTGKNTNVYRYTLSNCRGMTVKILTYGGIVQSISVPSRSGREANVVLGFKTLADYVKFDSPPVIANGGPYFGESIGRYGNRIAKGTFTLNQPGAGPVTYTLPINNNGNSLHGGLVGWGNHIWAARAVHGKGTAGVQLTLVSPNRDESHPAGSPGCPNGCTGYPAKLKAVVTYTLNNAGQLAIHYKTTDESPNLNSVINQTNHSYFNLAGEASAAGSAYGQYVQMNANKYTPTDATQIPLGYNVPVAGTPFDFRAPHTIGSRIDDVSAPDNAPAQFNQLLIAQGYDHNWVLNQQTRGDHRPGRAEPRRARPGSGERPRADRVDRPAGRAVLQRQLPQRHAGGHQRPHLPAGRGLHVRDPALPELPEPAELPVHRDQGRADHQLDHDLRVQLITMRPA